MNLASLSLLRDSEELLIALFGEMQFRGIAMATPMVMCSKPKALSMGVGARCPASCTYYLVCCRMGKVPIWWSERLAEGTKLKELNRSFS